MVPALPMPKKSLKTITALVRHGNKQKAAAPAEQLRVSDLQGERTLRKIERVLRYAPTLKTELDRETTSSRFGTDTVSMAGYAFKRNIFHRKTPGSQASDGNPRPALESDPDFRFF